MICWRSPLLPKRCSRSFFPEFHKRQDKEEKNTVRKGKQVSALALAIFLAILAIFASGSIMLVLTLIQQNLDLWIRLITLGVLPGPILALSMGLIVWIFTNSRGWGIVAAIASYLLAVGTALPVQRFIINQWRRFKK